MKTGPVTGPIWSKTALQTNRNKKTGKIGQNRRFERSGWFNAFELEDLEMEFCFLHVHKLADLESKKIGRKKEHRENI